MELLKKSWMRKKKKKKTVSFYNVAKKKVSLTNRLPFWVPLLEPWARAEKIGPTPIRPAIMYQYKKKKVSYDVAFSFEAR